MPRSVRYIQIGKLPFLIVVERSKTASLGDRFDGGRRRT